MMRRAVLRFVRAVLSPPATLAGVGCLTRQGDLDHTPQPASLSQDGVRLVVTLEAQCIEDDVYSAAALHRVDPAFVRVGKRTGSQLNQARTVFRRSGSEILGRLGASITSGAHGPPHHSGRARKPFGLPAHVPRASKRKSGVVRPHGPRPARRKIRAPSSDEAP
jgi:hypothetical protein